MLSIKQSLLVLSTLFINTLIFSNTNLNSAVNEDTKIVIDNDFCTSGTNLSLNGTIADFSAEENSTNTVENILNEDETNRWSAETYPQHAVIDLGEIQNIDEVILAPYLNRDYQFTIEGSSTSATAGFSTLVDASNNTTSTSLITKSFDTASVRYVKLTITGANSYTGDWVSINYLSINCAGGEDTSTNYSGIFNLTDFEIETSWLTGEDNTSTESFDPFDTNDKDWYTKNGDTYWLKSLKTDGNRTEWKEYPGNESSLFTYKKMLYKAIVEDIPKNGVTIAQVHNRGGVSRPFLRVYIDNDRHIKIKVTTTDPNANSSSYDVYDGPLYSEGTDFTVEILTQDGNVSINIETTNGSMSETITPEESAWDDFSNSYYLKAGVYTEGDDTTPKITFDYFILDKTNSTLDNNENIIEPISTNILIYPNPFIDTINVDFTENNIATVTKIKVFDTLGRLLLTKNRNLQENSIQLKKNFSSGFYYIQLLDINNNVIAIKKIINN